jgi:hypothetical protein
MMMMMMMMKLMMNCLTVDYPSASGSCGCENFVVVVVVLVGMRSFFQHYKNRKPDLVDED